MPPWGEFAIALGESIGEFTESGNRLIVGLSLPTRAYAAALIALGVVFQRVQQPTSEAETKEHFRELCALREGLPVDLLYVGKMFKGALAGTANYEGHLYVKVQLTANVERSGACNWFFIKEEDSLDIQIADRGAAALPLKLRGKLVVDPQSFLLPLFDDPGMAWRLCARSQMDCLIVGRRNILEQELCNTEFAFRTDGNFQSGHLQEIVRVRQFVKGIGSFRSSIFPDLSRRHPKTGGRNKPYAVLFDGPRAFLKLRHYWYDSHWVVVLDRTQREFTEAADTLCAEYVQDRSCNGRAALKAGVPRGVEMISFQEAK